MKEEEKIKPKWLEKWEKESYEKGWKDGRKELIGEIEKIMVKKRTPISNAEEFDIAYIYEDDWKKLIKVI
jgi:hypothetical protein